MARGKRRVMAAGICGTGEWEREVEGGRKREEREGESGGPAAGRLPPPTARCRHEGVRISVDVGAACVCGAAWGERGAPGGERRNNDPDAATRFPSSLCPHRLLCQLPARPPNPEPSSHSASSSASAPASRPTPTLRSKSRSSVGWMLPSFCVSMRRHVGPASWRTLIWWRLKWQCLC